MSERLPGPRPGAPTLIGRVATPTLVTSSAELQAERLTALLVAPLGASRDALKSALAPMPIDLDVATDLRRVAETLESNPVDVVLADSACLANAGHEMLRAVRSVGRAPFIVALVDRLAPRQLADLMNGGVNEFVRLPLHVGELGVRLRNVKHAASARRSRPSWAALHALPPLLAGDLSGLASVSFAVADELGDDFEDVVGATITLTHPQGNTELELCVSMGRAVAETTLTRVLGVVPNRAMVADLLAEVANLSAGAMKRCMATGGVVLTLGLPRQFEGQPQALAREPAIAFDLVSSSGVVRCVVASRAATVVGLPLHALREGLVLARDVRSASGMLLLTAGVRLTNSTVERLQRSLDQSVRVEVVDPSVGRGMP